MVVVPAALLIGATTIAADIIDTIAGTGSGAYSGDGGPATAAEIKLPAGVAVDAAGNIYIADTDNNRIRKVDAVSGVIDTIAGTGNGGYSGDGGPATAAEIKLPAGVAVDAAGNIYIADTVNHTIRKIDAVTGVINTVAGTGSIGSSGDGGAATAAKLRRPASVAVDAAGNIYIADTDNNRIRKVDAVTGVIDTIAGTGQPGDSGDGGAATAAKLRRPAGVAVDAAGNIYIADTDNNRIRKVDAVTGVIGTIAGTGTAGHGGDGGPASSAWLHGPTQLLVDGSLEFGHGTVLASSQMGDDAKQIATRVMLPADGTVTSITAYVSGDTGKPYRYAIYSDSAGEPDTLLAETAAVNPPPGPVWFTISLPATPLTAGGYWLALSADSVDHTYNYDPTGGRTRTKNNWATAFGYTATWENSDASNARRVSVYATYLEDANELYVADSNNSCIRKFTEGGMISTVVGTATPGFSGDGGPATVAQIDSPAGVAVIATGILYIADTANNRIRNVEPGRSISILRWQEVEPQ